MSDRRSPHGRRVGASGGRPFRPEEIRALERPIDRGLVGFSTIDLFPLITL